MFSRSRRMAAALMASAFGLSAGNVGGKTPVAKTKGKARFPNPNARYHGGKHTSGALPHIHEQYINEAQAKRERKNTKRALKHGWAVRNNPCLSKAA
ncbi:hypothetical protein PP761_gp28 [Stenotrophomonas phage Paxi]|uniref:Uncharacterized protein n=1 Tax=Stenotrophomonas phage Paxi TaxID=2859653 RepID=A0AAE7WM68_9CAUD|nr:hypothetical protein PP761_gp28 [Stenotrophomonas phage Paxi]QYW01799.1 hypothetical protein CPT_Paxi_028 [Stenotrophomonas phage Paxi]